MQESKLEERCRSVYLVSPESSLVDARALSWFYFTMEKRKMLDVIVLLSRVIYNLVPKLNFMDLL